MQQYPQVRLYIVSGDSYPEWAILFFLDKKKIPQQHSVVDHHRQKGFMLQCWPMTRWLFSEKTKIKKMQHFSSAA